MTGWKQIDKYHMRNGEWIICKVFLDGATLYELWSKEAMRGGECKGYFECAADAVEAHKGMTE